MVEDRVRNLVHSLKDGKKVSIGLLVKEYGLATVAEAERAGFIDTEDNEFYRLALGGKFLIRTTENNDIRFRFDKRSQTLQITLDRFSPKLDFKISTSGMDDVHLAVSLDDDKIYSHTYPRKSVNEFLSLLLVFHEQVLYKTAGIKGEE